MDNYTVIYKNLPHKVHAFTMYSASDSYYTIVLNSKISYNCAQKAFKHELFHILSNDFVDNKNINQIENLAHSIF